METPETGEQTGDDDDDNLLAIVVGVVVGVLVVIAVVVILIFLICLWSQRKKKSGKYQPSYTVYGKQRHMCAVPVHWCVFIKTEFCGFICT